MSSSVNNQAPPPSPAAGADVPRTPDTVATVSDSLSLTNSILIVLIGYLLWKMFGKRIGQKKDEEEADRYVIPDPLPKHDMTLEELRKYDGKGPDKRVCIAILGRVYDCSKSYHFYGPEGTYRNFAGHDATRALAKFDVLAVKEEWDDVSDLSPSEMSSVEEWKEQFEERYDFVGRLVRSAEEIEEEEPPVTDDSADASKIAKEGGGGGDSAQQPSKQASSESSEGSDLEVIKSEELAEQK